MKKYIALQSIFGLVLVLPVVASAQGSGEFGFSNFFTGIIGFINATLIPILLAIAFLVFIIGAVRYFILAGEGTEDKTKGKNAMLWGIIGFVLIVSIWGIVSLLTTGLGFNETELKDVPAPPTR